MSVLLIRADARALPLADESVDSVVTDPPYGISGQGKVQKSGSGDGIVSSVSFGHWDLEPMHEHFDECFRILRAGGALISFCDMIEVTTARNRAVAAGFRSRQTFYWVKANPPPNPRKNFRSGIEVALYCVKPGRMIWWRGGQPTNYWIEPITASSFGRLLHPCQKPVPLMRHLVSLVTPPGGTVCDMFAGSGSTGVAARIDGRNAILVERDSAYVQTIRTRMAGADSVDECGELVFLQPRLTFTEEGAA